MRYVSLIAAMLTLFACAGPRPVVKPFAPDQILDLAQFRALKDPATVSQRVLFLDAGDTIPLKIDVDSDLVRVSPGQVDLVLEKPLYFNLRLPPTLTAQDFETVRTLAPEALAGFEPQAQARLLKGIMLFVSRDGTHWAPLNNPAVLKAALGIQGGSFSLGMAMNEEEGLWAMLTLKIISKPDADNP